MTLGGLGWICLGYRKRTYSIFVTYACVYCNLQLLDYKCESNRLKVNYIDL